MRSCTVVVVTESLDKDDVTFAAKPKTSLRAVPLNSTSKQIVKEAEDMSVDVFSVFETNTSLPANLTGMALFITLKNTDDIVAQVKGKVNSDIKNIVHFKTIEESGITKGFYQYDVVVKAANEYEQSLLSGSYVVR
jgi:hypothetical protein